jgi:hypothetical protein
MTYKFSAGLDASTANASIAVLWAGLANSSNLHDPRQLDAASNKVLHGHQVQVKDLDTALRCSKWMPKMYQNVRSP